MPDKDKMAERLEEFKDSLRDYRGSSRDFIQTFMLYFLLAEINERLESLLQEVSELNERDSKREDRELNR